MEEKVLYHKKFKHGELTLSKTSWKDKTSFVIGLIVLGLAIWYFTR